MKIGPIRQFLIIGAAVGVIAPFFISVCLFGTTLQTFVSGAGPTPGYWSGSPTAAPTLPPSQVHVWTGAAFSSAGGAVFVVWSVLGALAGEAIAIRRRGQDLDSTRKAWLGAIAGSILFMAVALFGGFLK